jgi:hypothetical protein
MANFLLLNPDFFFLRQRASAKGCARALFLGVVFMIFFFFNFFFNLRGISVGEFSESKILKMSGHVRKPLKLGALYRKAGSLSSPPSLCNGRQSRRPRPVTAASFAAALFV